MAPITTLDIMVGITAVIASAVAIYFFIKASSSSEEKEIKSSILIQEPKKASLSRLNKITIRNGGVEVTSLDKHLKKSDMDKATSKIRTLNIQSEILGSILKRLFEAEDEGEITRDERIQLSKGYETDLKRVNEELKKAELVVSLHELESIRDDILKKFEATLNNTQARINEIVKELGLDEIKKVPRRIPREREQPLKKEEEEEVTVAEEEIEKPRVTRPKSEVEAKLEELRKEVLKELEELEKLEIEV